MKLLIFSFLFSLCVNHESNIAMAFPTGAAGCASSSNGAVEGPHLTYSPITTGSLATGSFQIFLDATTALQPDTPPTFILPSQEYTLSIVPSNGATFLGALFRVEGADVSLIPGTNAQEASVCTAPVLGVTHIDATPKTDFEATIQVDGTDTVLLDVTIVVANTASTGSIYYYSQYVLQPTDAGSTPMATPIVAPVAEPTMVEAPVAEPTMMEVPVVEPTEVPMTVVAPTSVPITMVEPTVTPVAVAEPTATPSTESSSYSPVMESTQSEAPVGEETMESDAPSPGLVNVTMNMTDSNSTTPMSSPVRAPTMIAAPTTTSFAVMKLFPSYASLLALVTAVVITIV